MAVSPDFISSPAESTSARNPARGRGISYRSRVLLACVAGILFLGSVSSSPAQSLGRTGALTRQQTVDLIAHVLADVQANFPSPDQALSLEQAVVQTQLAVSTTKIMDLRDALSDNGHIRILTFSIDLPSGVSVQFDFPPEDRGE
jgi:hypothetical protein